MDNKEIKDFYRGYADRIQDKRTNSPYKIRRYFHKVTHQSALKHIKKGDRVLEVGCGEGVLAVMMAKVGAKVTATDISTKNLSAAKDLAKKEGVEIEFLEADLENLPFQDSSFDIIVADNVLEHLPDFDKGLAEIKRVTNKKALIILPTCFNGCALCLLGQDVYWKITRRTPYAIFVGLARVIMGLVKNEKGVDQGYSGAKGLPHLLRFPWKMRQELIEAGWKIKSFEAVSICLPYLSFLLPLTRFLDKFRDKPVLRDLGFCNIAVVEKPE